MDVGDWLHGLGLEQYLPAFVENAIGWDVLPKLTADDLKEIGVGAVGDRRRLLEAIAALPKAPSERATATGSAGAERRQLTVMFCDLVGSTELAARLDPEDLRTIIGHYHRALAKIVARFDGFIAKYMGDGAIVYFGYPNAHEDDAERAVRAALALIDEAVIDTPGGKLSFRIGIATGLAVVGDLIGSGVAQEESVIGETPNLAARLQARAEPGTTLIDDDTRRLIGGLFEFMDLGPQELRGFGDRKRVWRVAGEGQITDRFEALRSGETPLVGRDEELNLLLRRWSQANTGKGRVVLLAGEPGIGKSRLTAALRQRVEGQPHYAPSLFLPAAPSGQRASSIHRPS
jgi:class 3 adenylate cyclase